MQERILNILEVNNDEEYPLRSWSDTLIPSLPVPESGSSLSSSGFCGWKLVVQLGKLSEAIKIEARGLKMKMDPTGSITISSQENRINIKIDPKGSISHTSTLPLSLSPEKIEKEVIGTNKISLKSDDLSSGEIELVLKEKVNVNKKDLLLLPLVWKIGKKGYRTVVEKKKTSKIEW